MGKSILLSLRIREDREATNRADSFSICRVYWENANVRGEGRRGEKRRTDVRKYTRRDIRATNFDYRVSDNGKLSHLRERRAPVPRGRRAWSCCPKDIAVSRRYVTSIVYATDHPCVRKWSYNNSACKHQKSRLRSHRSSARKKKLRPFTVSLLLPILQRKRVTV